MTVAELVAESGVSLPRLLRILEEFPDRVPTRGSDPMHRYPKQAIRVVQDLDRKATPAAKTRRRLISIPAQQLTVADSLEKAKKAKQGKQAANRSADGGEGRSNEGRRRSRRRRRPSRRRRSGNPSAGGNKPPREDDSSPGHTPGPSASRPDRDQPTESPVGPVTLTLLGIAGRTGIPFLVLRDLLTRFPDRIPTDQGRFPESAIATFEALLAELEAPERSPIAVRPRRAPVAALETPAAEPEGSALEPRLTALEKSQRALEDEIRQHLTSLKAPISGVARAGS
ncbi:MAG: hypothetical protein AAF604_24630 [Acidobacteriota bacterium]